MSLIIEKRDGKVEWTEIPGDRYVVTGKDTKGKPFRQTFTSYRSAASINLYRGSIWLERQGRRYLLQRIYN